MVLLGDAMIRNLLAALLFLLPFILLAVNYVMEGLPR